MVVVVIIWIFTIPSRFQVESGKLTLGNFINQIKDNYKQATSAPAADSSTTQTPTSGDTTTPAPASDTREQTTNDVKLGITKVDTTNGALEVSFTLTSSSDQLVTLPKQADVQVIQLGATKAAQTLMSTAADSTAFPVTLLSNTSVDGIATFSGVSTDKPYQLTFNNLVPGPGGQPFSFSFNY